MKISYSVDWEKIKQISKITRTSIYKIWSLKLEMFQFSIELLLEKLYLSYAWKY